MIERLDDPAAAGEWCARERAAGRSLGFVPTMGALHPGHLALVRSAIAANERACASVFVNPLQFDDPEDLRRYPRELEADTRALDELGAHMVFSGTLEQFFPGRLDAAGTLPPGERVDPGPAAVGLEGDFRPGHFEGVATIVDRLFDVVLPDRAYFGRKDFQQCLVVRDLARRRGGPEIVVCPTARESSGLARSSRNELLAPRERERAAGIFAALRGAQLAWRAGLRAASELERGLRADLQRAGIEVEYAELRDPERWDLGRPEGELERAVALVAARVGGVRLIDNCVLHEPEDPPS